MSPEGSFDGTTPAPEQVVRIVDSGVKLKHLSDHTSKLGDSGFGEGHPVVTPSRLYKPSWSNEGYRQRLQGILR